MQPLWGCVPWSCPVLGCHTLQMSTSSDRDGSCWPQGGQNIPCPEYSLTWSVAQISRESWENSWAWGSSNFAQQNINNVGHCDANYTTSSAGSNSSVTLSHSPTVNAKTIRRTYKQTQMLGSQLFVSSQKAPSSSEETPFPKVLGS